MARHAHKGRSTVKRRNPHWTRPTAAVTSLGDRAIRTRSRASSECSAAPENGRGEQAGVSARIRSLITAVQINDDSRIEEAVLDLSRSRRIFAPLAFAVGAFALLFDGLRLLVSNWRLTLVQIVPAMWIWLAMFDIKLHVLHGKTFNVLRGPALIPVGVLIITITIASFFLNAVFAFAIARSRKPKIRPAVAQARQHIRPIAISGAVFGGSACLFDDCGDALGTTMVHAVARDRRRPNDGRLRCGPVPADRSQTDVL
jgi:hypothetical protein